MSSPILITVPKIVSANSLVFKDYVDCNPEPSKGRKRRLDHLTWEEKLQRKKLKNRVAAQTSRDRKKLRMDEMESQIQTLMNQNELLLKECQKLKSLNQKLTSENQKLQQNVCHCHKSKNTSVTDKVASCLSASSVVDSRPSRSAESIPQPKGEGLESAAVLKKRREVTLMVLKMLLVCLMTKDGTFLKNSTSQNLKSLQKVCWRMSPEIWKKLMDKNRLQQIVSHKITQEKWWGRHQNNWNPVETIA